MAIPPFSRRAGIDYSQPINYNGKSKIKKSQLIMFTGLIQQVCSVKTLSKSGDTAVLTVDIRQQAKIGDSIAINGVCLTVAKLAGTLATFDISGETLTKTTIGKLTTGSKVNVELALTPTDRFGGHFVLGHIDGTATIKRIDKKAGSTSSPQGDFATFTFKTPKDLLEQIVPKGSVAVDGISLTIAEINAEGFTVACIPQTLKQTTLGEAKINQTVNIETDIISKTVKRYLDKLTPQNGLTIDGLRRQGF
jgi:riboflavin synthase